MKAALITVAFVLLLSCAQTVAACSCAGWSTVCGAYQSAEAVFVGTVTSVENETAKGDDGREYVVGQVAHVQVDEAFKGAKEPELIFRSYGTSCDPTYKEGQRWLFYASYQKEQKVWSIGMCGRSTWLEYASADLLYLRALPASAQKTRFAGTLTETGGKPLAGIKVKLSGERDTYEAVTDKNGVYEVVGLPGGWYTVDPEIPSTLKLWFSLPQGEPASGDKRQIKVRLAEKSCSGVNLVFTENTRVSGRVFGADGRPMHNVCVRLWLKDKQFETPFLLDCTDDDGRYEIKDIDLGDYYLVANDDGRISSEEPFPLTYYPGVFEKEKATLLTFGSGDKFEDFDFHIPSQQPTKTIQGKVVFSDGRAAPAVSVEFTAEPENGGQNVYTQTDAEGRFKIPLLEGLKGSMRANAYAHNYESCPQIQRLQNAHKDIVTNVVRIQANRDYLDLELVFPFPYCARTKAK